MPNTTHFRFVQIIRVDRHNKEVFFYISNWKRHQTPGCNNVKINGEEEKKREKKEKY